MNDGALALVLTVGLVALATLIPILMVGGLSW